MFGASSTLLNADHYSVYFKDMPLCNGKVLSFFLECSGKVSVALESSH